MPRAAAYATATGRQTATSGAMTELPRQELAGQRAKTAPQGRTGPRAAGPREILTPRARGLVLAGLALAGLVLAGLVLAGLALAGLAVAIVARLVAAALDRIPPLAGPPVDPARTVRRGGRLAAGPGKARHRVMQAVTVPPGRPVDAKATGRRSAARRGLGRERESVTGAQLRSISPGRPVRRCQIRSAPTNSTPKHVPS